jgi:hypothetical protein
MGSPRPSVGHVRGVAKPCSMDRRSISITASRYTPGERMPERTAKGFTQPVTTNDTNKASLPANRLERQAGKLARAVLRGGGDGDTASLPDRPLHSRFRPRLTRGVDMTSDVKSRLLIFLHGLRPLVFRPSAEAEPVRDDG